MKTSVLLGVALCVVGCASTDPREGGLIGYWRTGAGGYERRLDERRESLSAVEAETRGEQAQADALGQEGLTLRGQIQAQREELSELDRRIEGLSADCEALQAQNAAQEAERSRILGELDTVRARARRVGGDSTLELADRQQALDALRAEVELLLERYSLLTTL